LVKKLDKLWKIKTVALYPEKWDVNHAEGWSLARRYGAIQIPLNMLTISYVAHEHAHCVVECFRDYDGLHDIREPGHGPLWVSVFAYNYSKVIGVEYIDVLECLTYNGILLLDETTLKQFRRYFRD
jgi:hypothetical protein